MSEQLFWQKQNEAKKAKDTKIYHGESIRYQRLNIFLTVCVLLVSIATLVITIFK